MRIDPWPCPARSWCSSHSRRKTLTNRVRCRLLDSELAGFPSKAGVYVKTLEQEKKRSSGATITSTDSASVIKAPGDDPGVSVGRTEKLRPG